MDRITWVSGRISNGQLKRSSPQRIRWMSWCDVCCSRDNMEEGQEYKTIHGWVGCYKVYWYVCMNCDSKIDARIIFLEQLFHDREKRRVEREIRREVKRSIFEYKRHVNVFKERLSYLRKEV